MKISVIVPVYNVENYLEKCLNSLVNQTLQEIEILVINDGSTDDSQKIIDVFQNKFPEKIKAFIKESGGLDRRIDWKNVVVYRKFPEGIKKAQIDLTREDIQNSPYFWVQNGDLIMFNTRAKSFYGFGKEPIQTLTTGVTLLTTALSIYLLFSKL